MFIDQPPFYFATLRKISVAFGSLFNNVYIQRFDQPGGAGNVLRTIRVPLSYAAGEKWYIHRYQDIPAQSAIQTRISLPRIGYELTGMQYDANRQINPFNCSTSIKDGDVNTFLNQLGPVPYDFTFDVHIAAKNIDDGHQMIEQILPTFHPSHNLSIKDIPELAIVKDIPIIFGGITKTDTYEGGFDDTRVLEWTLSFVVKGYLYPPIKDAAIIRRVLTSIYKDEALSEKQGVITVNVEPSTASFDDPWTAETETYTEDQLDTNGQPIIDPYVADDYVAVGYVK